MKRGRAAVADGSRARYHSPPPWPPGRGETAHLAVREARQVFFIDHHASGKQGVIVPGHTGKLLPLHCTAHGKALLADFGLPELKALYGSTPLEKYTNVLQEQLVLDGRGRIANLGSLDYRIPTIEDVPAELHSILIENEDGPDPYGAKGAGEGGTPFSAAPGSIARPGVPYGYVLYYRE